MTEPRQTDLWIGGQDGYHTYRIPALLGLPGGRVLAFCEGRRDSASDQGEIDLLCRHSDDGGHSWGPVQVVDHAGGFTCGNPCPLYDAGTGTVWLPMTRNPAPSRLPRWPWITRSTDRGATWETPRDLSDAVKRPDWAWYATGPGQGCQLASGRLVVPANHTVLGPDGREQTHSHLLLSDDGGASWRIGAIHPDTSNESRVVELPDGSVYLNARTGKTLGRRAWARSLDGGESFAEIGLHDELIEPRQHGGGCQASLLRLCDDRLLFANPASDAEIRQNLALRLSPDAGRTWGEPRPVCPPPMLSAYSDVAQLADGTVLCLYECGQQTYCERLRLARLSPDWLEAGAQS